MVRYRQLWAGLLLLAGLSAILLALLAWGDRVLSLQPSGGIASLLQATPAAEEPREARPTVARGWPSSFQGTGPFEERHENEASLSRAMAAAASTQTDAAITSITIAEFAPTASEAGLEGQSLKEEVPAAPPHAEPAADRHAETIERETLGPSPERYAVEIGNFVSSPDADRVEAQLNRAGFATVRFRHDAAATLYSVIVEPVAGAEEAASVVDSLRRGGFPDAVARGGRRGFSVRVGDPEPFRLAIQLASRLRQTGFQAWLAPQPGSPPRITLRHGSFATPREAEATSREVTQLGLANEVIRVK
jgi:cell division protein FtsN